VTAGRPDGPRDVLAQPTRSRLFAHLASLGRPAGTRELAAELGRHPSGVRVHLERLHAAGLITRDRTPETVGRPRDRWSIASDMLPGGEPCDAYPQLARWLARTIPARQARLREVVRAGRELGREVSSPGSGPADEAIGRSLTALGFAPQRHPAPPGRVEFRLDNCPYREAARDNQPVVCALHRGLTRGLLDGLAPRARLTSFEPRDPDLAGCRFEVSGLQQAAATDC